MRTLLQFLASACWSLSFGLVTALWAPGSALAADVELVAPTEPSPEGTAVAFTVKEALEGSLFVDACAPVELEQKREGRWVTVPVKVCDRPLPATEFDTSLTFSLPTPPSGAGTYRAALAYGRDCTAGLAFIVANCKSLAFVVSEAFVVSPPAAR